MDERAIYEESFTPRKSETQKSKEAYEEEVVARQIQKVRGLDRKTNELQDNIVSAVQPFLTNPLNDGIIITDIEIDGVSATEVNHLLGRLPQGYIIIDKDAESDIYRDVLNTRQISFLSSNAVTIGIYIF